MTGLLTLPESVDVLVIGCGPAGANAAREAAQAGATTVALEAKATIGEHCHCAEWVPALLARDVDLPGRVRRQSLSALKIEAGTARAEASVRGMVIDRPVWEKDLAVAATKAGATIFSGTKFTGFDDQGRAVVDGPGGRRTIKARVVIAADGALSRVASVRGWERQPGVPAVQAELDAASLDHGLTAFRPDLIGYMWFFPKAGTANVGLGGRALGRVSLREMLLDWRNELAARGLIGLSVFRYNGGFIPNGGLRDRLVSREIAPAVVLAGDAAGLTHPLTGAGIPQAVQSGQMVGRAAADWAGGKESALAEYQTEVQDRWAGYLGRGVKKRNRAQEIWETDFIEAAKVYWPLWPKARGGRP